MLNLRSSRNLNKGCHWIAQLVLFSGTSLFVLSADTFLLSRVVSEGILIRSAVLFVLFSLPLVAYVLSSASLRSRLRLILGGCRTIILSFLGIAFLNLLGGFSVQPPAEQDYRYILAPIFGFYVLLIGFLIGGLSIGWNSWRHFFRFCFLLTVSTVFLDTIFPGTFSNQWVRAAGLSVNANAGARLIMFLMPLCLRWKARLFSISDIVILVVGGAGVFLTFSISGVILYVSLLFSYTFYALFTRGLGKTWVKYAFIVVCLSVMLPIAFSDLSDITRMSKLRKSERVRIFFEDPTELHQSRALAARMDLVKQSLRLIGERPFLGWGSGYFFFNANFSP